MRLLVTIMLLVLVSGCMQEQNGTPTTFETTTIVTIPTTLVTSTTVSTVISQHVITLCKEKGKITCYGDCVDGFGEDCYFDSMKYNKSELKTDIYLPEETKKACFAVHSSSTCGKCYNKFELKINGKLVEVSCEEFFQAIEDKNESCNGCIDTVYGGCC